MSRLIQLLDTFEFEYSKLSALHLIITLKNPMDLKRMKDALGLSPDEASLISKKIGTLNIIDQARNLSIILFFAGIAMDIGTIILQWL
jgi:hypothetical protein